MCAVWSGSMWAKFDIPPAFALQKDNMPDAFFWVDFCLDGFFILDYCFFLYISDQRYEYATKPSTIADFMSCLPVLSVLFDHDAVTILAVCRFFRCTRILKIYHVQALFPSIFSNI